MSSFKSFSLMKIPRKHSSITNEKRLHRILDETDMENIHKQFLNVKNPSTNENAYNIDREQFRNILNETAKLTFDNDEFNVLFRKIAMTNTDFITWDEFISHILVGFQEDNVMSSEVTPLQLPITEPFKLFNSHHRNPIVKMEFYPDDKGTNFLHGSYLSLSKDGCINQWSIDLKLQHTYQSTSHHLKIKPTWILDFTCLPNINVVALSNTERELLFYDFISGFDLQLIVTNLPSAVTCMCYHNDGTLVMGDQYGSVIILTFTCHLRGPFKRVMGRAVDVRTYTDLLNGHVPLMRVVEIHRIHNDWVRQIHWYGPLNSFVSVSGCPAVSMFISDATQNSARAFKVTKGVYCACISESNHLIATGGADSLIRVWSTFVNDRPLSILSGHHAVIDGLVFQLNGHQLFSISTDKCVKVWNLSTRACLQTFVHLPSELGEHSRVSLFYNPRHSEVFVACMKIAVITCSKGFNANETDGVTHCGAVTIVLYNPLFKRLVTCSRDSMIIVWDPCTGSRLIIMKACHTKIWRGEVVLIEISAACFDPTWHRLVTGVRDGTLKIWNFNTGKCLRNLNIGGNNEVTSVYWFQNRILACGWNRFIVEFQDDQSTTRKHWETRHTEDIVSGACRSPQTIATATFNGELILWRLETAQPYRKYHVTNPQQRVPLYAITRTKQREKVATERKRQLSRVLIERRKSLITGVTVQKQRLSIRPTLASVFESEPVTLKGLKERARRVSIIPVPTQMMASRKLAVQATIFLETRPMDPNIGSLLVSLSNGHIQLYSHHVSGGLVATFQAIHKAADYVIAMATDARNRFLFTAHVSGYIKTWLMENYGLAEAKRTCMPKLRLVFPFLWRDTWECRAKRAVRGQDAPVLLNSYLAHLCPVVGVVYADDFQFLASCSGDGSVRLWNISGQYLGTVGSFLGGTPNLQPGILTEYKIPPDIRRVASFTTMKVLCGGNYRQTSSLTKPGTDGMSETKTDGTVHGWAVRPEDLDGKFRLPRRKMMPNGPKMTVLVGRVYILTFYLFIQI